MSQSSPPVDAILRGLEQAVAAGETAVICREIKQLLRKELGSGRKFLPPEFSQPNPDSYARRLFYKDPQGLYSVVVMTWGPGQETPLHDHAGHWCVECVYEGRIQVTSYDLSEEAADGTARFEQKSRVVSSIGGAGALIPPFEYHTIGNPFEEPAVTLHVYEGEITWCNVFEPQSRDGWFTRERRTMNYN